ncbi:MAG: hypothetical protein ACXVHM_07040, partial [Methanobacterium sp.]
GGNPGILLPQDRKNGWNGSPAMAEKPEEPNCGRIKKIPGNRDLFLNTFQQALNLNVDFFSYPASNRWPT